MLYAMILAVAYDLKALCQVIERNALERCTSCGEAEWAMPNETVLLQQVDPDLPATRLRGIPAVPVVCGSCGYIRLHSVRMLEKKLKSEGHDGSR
jgi:hypothetical protein